MRKYFFFFFCGLFFLSCNNSSSVTVETDTATKDQVLTSLPDRGVDTTANNVVYTRAPKGIYKVQLSSGEQIINFHTDQSFLLEEKTSENKITRTQGSWKPTNGTIWTYNEQIVQGRYSWIGDTLAYIDPKTQKTYKMQKLTSALENNVWRNKKKEGLEFFGVGNEPFWSIEIDEQKKISFQLADWNKPLVFKPASPSIFSDSLVYTASTDSAAIKITVFNQFCSDGMSDYIYDNKVQVLYNKQLFTGCGILYK